MQVAEVAKYWGYRLPLIRQSMRPRYDYKVCPGQLAAMMQFIDATAGTDAAIVEVGVARGQTSMFLLEHLRTTGDDRPLYLVDTFSGFTAASIATETEQRGKKAADFERFRYGSRKLLHSDLKSAGYDNFVTVQADATTYDWRTLGSIGAMLLDVDVYRPTAATIAAAVPLLAPEGGIVVDDCVPDTVDDGAFQAYTEHLAASGRPFIRAGAKGAIIRGDHAIMPPALSIVSSAL